MFTIKFISLLLKSKLAIEWSNASPALEVCYDFVIESNHSDVCHCLLSPRDRILLLLYDGQKRKTLLFCTYAQTDGNTSRFSGNQYILNAGIN